MLLGSPLRAATSRSGSASPDERKADNSCAECITDFTRYGSREGGLVVLMDPLDCGGRHYALPFRFAQCHPGAAGEYDEDSAVKARVSARSVGSIVAECATLYLFPFPFYLYILS